MDVPSGGGDGLSLHPVCRGSLSDARPKNDSVNSLHIILKPLTLIIGMEWLNFVDFGRAM